MGPQWIKQGIPATGLVEGAGQDADGDGNIQIGGDGVVASDVSGSIVAGGDISIVEGDVISNFSLNPEEIFEIQKKLKEIARNTEILMRLNEHQASPHDELKDYEKILHEISEIGDDDSPSEEMLELFAQVDLDRRPSHDDWKTASTAAFWEDDHENKISRVFLTRTDTGSPLLIHMHLLEAIQTSDKEQLLRLARVMEIPFEENENDSESLRTLLIWKKVLDNMDLSPPVMLQLNKEAIENLCVIFMLEVSSDTHSNLQSLNRILHHS